MHMFDMWSNVCSKNLVEISNGRNPQVTNLVLAGMAMDMDMFVTTFTVCDDDQGPILLGLLEDGRHVGVRVTGFTQSLYITTSRTTTRDEMEGVLDRRVRPVLQKMNRLSPRVRPNLRVVERRFLVGDGPPTHLIEAIYGSAKSLKMDAKHVREKLQLSVYHDRLDPHLVFSAKSGVRCFSWVRCLAAVPAKERKTRCDVEVVCDVLDVSPASDDRPPPALQIVSFDLETDGLCWEKDEIRMVSVCASTGEEYLVTRHELDVVSAPGYTVLVRPDEGDLIETVCGLLTSLKAVFLTGWNIFRFDVQFLFERARLCKRFDAIARLSWLRREPRPVLKEMNSNAFGLNKIYHDDLEGLVTIDGYTLARKSSEKRSSYSLAAFAEWVGQAKGDVTYEEMVDAFQTLDLRKMRRVADYCVQDSRVVLAILQRMEEPQKVMAMTRLASVPPRYTIKRGQTVLTWGLIVVETHKQRMVINPTAPPEGATGYQGATVVDPVRGYHMNPVCVLDFTSLYPSIMIGYNVCFSTWCSKSPDKTVVDLGGGRTAEFRRDGPPGVLPTILRVLLEHRIAVKNKMKACTPGSVEYQQHNANQLALKVASNSVYGMTGAVTSPIYVSDVAASVTALGRRSLEKVMEVVADLATTGQIPKGARPLYGDTDSVFVELPGQEPGSCASIADLISRKCSVEFPPPMALLYEKTLCPFIIESKKRYAGYDVEAMSILIKGLSCKRRDYPLVVREAIGMVLDQLMKGGDAAPRRALESLQEMLERVATGTVSHEDLSITKELNRASYKTPPPHLVVSKKMARRTPDDPPRPGDRISYVVLTGTGNISNRVEELQEVIRLSLKPDYGYYADMICNQTSELMALAGKGVDFQAMAKKWILRARLFATHQSDLHAFFRRVEKTLPALKRESVAPDVEPKPKKQMTLDRFMSK